MELRQATLDDTTAIMAILDDARAYQRSMGFRQWEDDYPGRQTILADISSGDARLLADGSLILGYCLLASGDPAYDKLSLQWLHPAPYGVIHRLALSNAARGRHLTRRLFPLIEQDYLSRGIQSIRVDTGAENIIMQHLLLLHNYHPHGLHTFPWGPRLLFEKSLINNNV